jgi:5-methyltetrahydropteroyltriglutamate--homocysteine methyltransferase
VPIEPGTLARRPAPAVEEVVREQADAGVDVINGGEMSKPSYATCINDTARRLSVPHYFVGSL